MNWPLYLVELQPENGSDCRGTDGGCRHAISDIPGSAKEIGVVYAQPVPVCMSRSDMRKTPHMCFRTCPVNGAGIADGKERHINLNPFFTGPAPIK